MIKSMSAKDKHLSNKIFILLLAFILIFQTSCILGIDNKIEDKLKKKDNNTEQKDESNENKLIIKFTESPIDTNSKNLLLYINFDSHNYSKLDCKNVSFSEDKIFDKMWNENSTRTLINEHNKLCKLEGKNGNCYLKVDVDVSEKSVLSFQVKSNVIKNDVLKLNIDNNNYTVPHKGYGDTWKNYSITLEPGNHSIVWYIPKQYSYSEQLLNVIYIDNISIVKDQIETVEIYPKGLQETYIGGIDLKFYAVAKRADGSIIENLPVSYSVSGCGTIDPNGLFKPTGKGECTITATINGKTAVKSDIVVHGKNYLSDEVNIGGYKFSGNYTLNTGEKLDTENTKYDYPETPMSVNFDADGFFVLKGNTKCPLLIYVQKNETKYKTYYVIRKPGDFYKRVWLRFGPGKYIISIVEDPKMKFYDTGNSKYEGDLISSSGNSAKTLTVINTNKLPESEAIWLMPSEVVQSDSFYVSNVANSILSLLPRNATTGDKLRAIHDWELYNHYYDMVSVNHEEKRKRQDAESVLKYHMGVCEGYANLYAALARYEGIKTKVMCDVKTLLHAWNHVLYDDNKWYLVDVTWDDPVPPDAGDSYGNKIEDFGVGAENYTYFMTAHTDDKHTVAGTGDSARSSFGINQDIPKMKGLPDGWY